MRPTPVLALALCLVLASCGGDGPTQNRSEVKPGSAQLSGRSLFRGAKPSTSSRALLNGGRLGRTATAQSSVCLKYQKQLRAVQTRMKLGATEELKTRETTLNAKVADVCN